MANSDTSLVTVDVNIPVAKEKQGSELTKRAESTLKLAEAFLIERPEDFTLAGNELIKVGKSIDAIDAHRKDMTRPIDRAKAEIMDKFKPALALLESAKATINRKMMAYRDEQQRKAREAQAKLDEQARLERERLEAEAKKLEKRKPAKAQELREQAAATTAPVVAAAAVPLVKGAGTRKTWRCDENVDIIELCKAVISGSVATLAVEPNFVFLNEQARSLEEHFDARFPGCKATSTEKFGRTRG